MHKFIRNFTYLVTDLLFITASWVLSYYLLGVGPINSFSAVWYYLVIGLVSTCVFAWLFGMYSIIWRYAGFTEALRIVAVVCCTFTCSIILSVIAYELSFVWALVFSMLVFVSFSASRFALKFMGYFSIGKTIKNKVSSTRVIIIGAGSAATTIIRELHTSEKINMHPVCVLDDDSNKIGRAISGVKVVGRIDQVKHFAERYHVKEIIIAIPSILDKRKKEIIALCNETTCKVKIIPGLYQFAKGQLSVSAIKEVEISDLLGREQIRVNLDEIMGYIENKVVMVTGGGGSIGSELCRQIASHNPSKLIILDIYENNAYDIQQELKRKYLNLNLDVIIASVRDKKRIDDVFREERPQIVFHAAAHKHVPLMERNPGEAVKNNVGGTFNVADASGRYGVKKFIMISTDKAVNPTNVMGATKRICEMIVQAMGKKYDTDYVAVRFGNVLGSNGSVIPIFKKQILEGGPLTVTHKDIVRYFMTIPEAVSLVLQAGAYATGGEIFVLDMGEPVKIYDLAVNMIKLSGFVPFKDIEIEITGLRPGEKLYEERLMGEEGLKKTENELISIGKPLEFDSEKLFKNVEYLCEEAIKEEKDIKEKVKELVSTYNIDYGKK